MEEEMCSLKFRFHSGSKKHSYTYKYSAPPVSRLFVVTTVETVGYEDFSPMGLLNFHPDRDGMFIETNSQIEISYGKEMMVMKVDVIAVDM